MEPALYHNDVLLVRKSDVYPDKMWRRWVSHVAASYEEEELHQDALKVLSLDALSGRPVGTWQTGHTFLKPPSIYQRGCIIVFRAPDAEKYPSSEYRVKRVVGLGGQICRANDNFHRIEELPQFSLWLEGDNHEKSVDSRTYGPVCKNSVIGTAERIVWPPSRWGAIPCVTPPVPRSWWK